MRNVVHKIFQYILKNNLLNIKNLIIIKEKKILINKEHNSIETDHFAKTNI